MVFTELKKRFVVRSSFLFRVEYRLTEADGFTTPTSYNDIMESMQHIAENARKEIDKLKKELEAIGYRYIEWYHCDEQEDGLMMSMSEDGKELVIMQRGNLHELSNAATEKLTELGYTVVMEA